MSWLSRLVNVVRRDRVDREIDEEIRFHLAARAEDLASRGMPAEEARAQARRRFGNTLLLRESSRDIMLSSRLESILLDVAFGLRLWRSNKIVTAAAVVSLSLAIGACTAAFSTLPRARHSSASNSSSPKRRSDSASGRGSIRSDSERGSRKSSVGSAIT